MAKLTPQEFTEKHARRLKASTEDIRRGIERVQTAPTALAAAKADKMKAKLVESIDSGRWANNTRKVSLESWKQSATNVGVGRIAQGIDNAAPKVQAFAEQLLPAIDSAKAAISSMPDLTLEDSINRMVTFTRKMGQFKKK